MELAKIEITQNNEHGCHTEFVGGGVSDESHVQQQGWFQDNYKWRHYISGEISPN